MYVELSSGMIAAEPGLDGVWLPALEAEPYFTQTVASDATPTGRTQDGRFDTTHLAPDKAYRIGRDYLAHCIRYAYPMHVVREFYGPGARIIEFGAGRDLPLFRTLTHDHGAMKHYKPSRYVAMDLNEFKYRPQVSGIETTLLDRCNCVEQPERIPDEVFDLVVSFEVLEHMDKPDGDKFLDAIFDTARRRRDREQLPGRVVLSTPVNNGKIAKNHIYEWARGELRRGFEARGGKIVGEHGTFANIADLVPELSAAERAVWNMLAIYHSPHVLSAIFSARHPEAARNICWLVEV